MNTIEITLRDIIKYTFGDYKNVLMIATLMLAISFFVNVSEIRSDIISPISVIIVYILIFIEVGYGAEIIKTSYDGQNTTPKLIPTKELLKEGVKRTVIYVFYGLICILLYRLEQYFPFYSIESSVCDILIIVVTILMCLGIINRFLHNGKFSKAFNLKEMLMLYKKFKIKELVYVIISMLIGQAFVVSCLVDINPGFRIIDAILMVLTFFLAPLSLISTKRLIGLTFKRYV